MREMNGEIDQFLQEALARGMRPDLASVIEGYGLCARAEGKSPKYISFVSASAKFLVRYLEASGLTTNVTDISAQHIRGFILHLQSINRFAVHPFAKPQHSRLSGYTVNAYMRSLRALWSWFEAEGITEQNPFSTVKIPRAPKKIIPTFSEAQIKALLAQVDILSQQGFRNYTIVLLLLDTMIRVSELTGCRMEDLNLEGRALKVWGKGSKERIVPFGRIAQKALWKYTTLYRPEPQMPRQDMLFLTADGRPMTKNRIEAILKAYGNKAAIRGVRVSPHTFRHTGAVAFLRNGGDVFSLQLIMGHSSLEVLGGYVQLSQGDLNRVHQRASPLDNLGLPMSRVMRGKRQTAY
ncbi:tyrosine-type recombinase/integrase [Chloroflexota bacterium]